MKDRSVGGGAWLAALAAVALVAFPWAAAAQGPEANRHLYPSGTSRLALVDMTLLRGSGLFNEDISRGFQRAIEENEALKKVMSALEVKPDKITNFTFCETDQGRGPERVLFIMNAEFPYERAAASLAELGKAGELTTLSFNDLPVYFNHRAREANYFALVDGKTLISSANRRLVEDAIQGLTDLREPKPELGARLKWDEGGPAVLKLAGAFPDEAKTGLARVPQLAEIAKHLTGYAAVARLGDQPRMQLRLSMDDAGAAANAVVAFKGLIQLGKLAMAANPNKDALELMEKLELKADGKDLLADITVSQEFFSNLLANGRKDRDRMEQRFRERRKQREAERGKDAPKPPAGA